MSDASAVLSLVPILAALNGQVSYASAIMIAFPAIAASLGIAYVGAKFLDAVARQPEAIGPLTIRLVIIAGLIDAGAMVSIAIGGSFAFANPFSGSILSLIA